MSLIKKRVRLFALVLGIGIAVCSYLFMMSAQEFYFPEYRGVLLYFLISMTFISAIILIKEYKKLGIARVIMENQILHIRSACSIIADSGKAAVTFPESRNIIISIFGILLDSKIIKFNQEGIQLKAVEIGQDYISLTYGTAGQTQTMQLIHAEIDNGELNKAVEKFRFETGVIPEILV